jgi:hypothetical protein
MTTYQTNRDAQYKKTREKHLQKLKCEVPISYIVDNFTKYVKRQELTRFLVRHELFKQIADIKGSIIECGVFAGSGLMAWAQLASILEPVGFWRRIYGFDTFDGFPGVHENDLRGVGGKRWKKGDIKDQSYEDLKKCIGLYDANRFLPQIPKVFLVKGDFTETADAFLRDHPHVIVALLYLDFDLYEPTVKALESFLPRMGKGSILAFDEINNPQWPGETQAMLEKLDIRNAKIQQFPYEPNMSYIVL